MRSFLRSTKGVTAIEYGIAAAGIALVILAAVNLVGNEVRNNFDEVARKLGEIAPASGNSDPCQEAQNNCGN